MDTPGIPPQLAAGSPPLLPPEPARKPSPVRQLLAILLSLCLGLFLADAGNGALTVTLTPLQSGFHLYGTALPDGGIDGVGRPTRVTVSGGLTGTGPVSADRPVVQLRVPGVSRPINRSGKPNSTDIRLVSAKRNIFWPALTVTPALT